MKKKFLAAFITAATVLSLAACTGKYPDKTRDDNGSDSLSLPPKTFGSESGVPADISAGSLDEDTLSELYNTYIDINNAMLGRVYDSLDRYFTYVDFESTDFKLIDESSDYYDCYSVSSALRDVEAAYEIVSGKGEKDALDQAFLDMYPSISSLLQTLNEISEYTSPKTYLEDGYAKSQEQHTALLNVLEEYYTTGDIFIDELSVVASQRQQEELEQLKADGYVVFYSLNMVINLGKDIDNELYNQGVWDENILDMDLTAIQPLYDEFSQYVDEVLAYSENEDALKAEGLNNAPNLSMFITNMKSARDSLSKVLAKVEAGEPLSEFDTSISSSIMGQCNLSSFEAAVSDMIDNYNRIISY